MLGQLQYHSQLSIWDLGLPVCRTYVRTRDGDLRRFYLSQAGRSAGQFPDVVQRAQRGDETTFTVTDDTGQSIRATAKWGTVEFDGVTLYAQEFSARPTGSTLSVYFQSQEVSGST